MGREWFKERDKWLEESLKADLEFMGKNPRAIEALLEQPLGSTFIARLLYIFGPHGLGAEAEDPGG